jgi:hypothetical protein
MRATITAIFMTFSLAEIGMARAQLSLQEKPHRN